MPIEICVEHVLKVHTGEGECFEAGSDPDGLGMVELRYISETGARGDRLSMSREVWDAIRKYTPEEDEEREEARVFAEEGFRVDVQYMIHKVMRRKGWSNEDLARALGVELERVDQFFISECNMTLRNIAGIFHVLGEQCSLTHHTVPDGFPQGTQGEAALVRAERDRVLDEVIGLVDRGGNPGEIGVLCEELKDGEG